MAEKLAKAVAVASLAIVSVEFECAAHLPPPPRNTTIGLPFPIPSTSCTPVPSVISLQSFQRPKQVPGHSHHLPGVATNFHRSHKSVVTGVGDCIQRLHHGGCCGRQAESQEGCPKTQGWEIGRERGGIQEGSQTYSLSSFSSSAELRSPPPCPNITIANSW